MLSKKELEIYSEELLSENLLGLRSIKLLEPAIVLNKRFTSDLKPKPTKSIKDPCWTDQWMALSEDFSGRCQCASCGKFIFADTEDPECIKIAKAYKDRGIIPDCTPDTLQIQGGHIFLIRNIIDMQNYILAKKGTIHITPLCKTCNNTSKRYLQLRYGVIITPEIRK